MGKVIPFLPATGNAKTGHHTQDDKAGQAVAVILPSIRIERHHDAGLPSDCEPPPDTAA